MSLDSWQGCKRRDIGCVPQPASLHRDLRVAGLGENLDWESGGKMKIRICALRERLLVQKWGKTQTRGRCSKSHLERDTGKMRKDRTDTMTARP
jgi:hypothetical protein